ncbi:MAG: multiple sugar transport system permease protein [Thermomicrobiales bacterium]|jgi:multiple sugar transport system permease protein|nr:multiple sugar transport system permease protein [Thermomicrobiales bacterium]
MAVATRQIAQPRSAAAGEERSSPLDVVLQIVAYLVLTLVAIAMFVPFIFSLTTSVKTPREANLPLTLRRLFWPEHLDFTAYQKVFDADIGRWFFNSAFVAVIWVIGRAFADSAAGYAFARMQFPGKNLLFVAVISTMMIPGMVTIVPKFLILKQLHLLDTYGALTLPFLADAFGIFLMRQFFESIPVELEEAARVDGASRYRMFAQIILPNAMPALTALAILSFQGSWNAFLEPLIFTNSPDVRTLPLGLAYFRQQNYTEWTILMAMAVITTLPMAIFYLFFQRWFVEGQVSSGIKG